MYRLLGVHVNNAAQGDVLDAIIRWKPPLVVILDHSDAWREVRAACPNTIIVGRVVRDDEPDFNDPDLDVEQVLEEHMATVLPWAERMRGIYDFWQGVNEPVIQSPDAMQRYSYFEETRAWRMRNRHDLGVVVGSFSVGNPELALWQHFLPALEAAHFYRGALALHEYAWPRLDRDWPWYLLRHRKVYHGEPAHGWAGLPEHLQSVPLLITEGGLDGSIPPPHQPQGWKTRIESWEGWREYGYLHELAWYDAELQRDPCVVGVALYCAGCGGQWATYDIRGELLNTLASQADPLYRLRQPAPSLPTPPKPPVPMTDAECWQQVMDILTRIEKRLQESNL